MSNKMGKMQEDMLDSAKNLKYTSEDDREKRVTVAMNAIRAEGYGVKKDQYGDFPASVVVSDPATGKLILNFQTISEQ